MKPQRLLTAIAVALILAAFTVPQGAAAVGSRNAWEAATLPRPQSKPDIEVMTSGQWVYVSSPTAVRVSLLTVLGQTLTEAELPAGVHRFRIASRGIYILRVSSSTYRITL